MPAAARNRRGWARAPGRFAGRNAAEGHDGRLVRGGLADGSAPAGVRRMDSPDSSMRCTFSSRRSKIPSATVGSPSASCHMATGSWLVTIVERSWARSSITSSTSAPWSGASGRRTKSSMTNTSTRAQAAITLGRRPSRPGDGDLVEQPGTAQIEGAVPVAHCRVGERTGEEGLPEPGGADDHDAVVCPHPMRLGQVEDLGAIEAPGPAEVDVLDGGLRPQFRLLQVPLEAPALALGDLPVDEQTQALLEAQALVVGALALLEQAPGHGGETQGVEAFDRLGAEHGWSSHW